MYHCPTHGQFRTLAGWTFHASWCNRAWEVVETEMVKAEARKAGQIERPRFAMGGIRAGVAHRRKSDAQVTALARANGLNPWQTDWADGLDTEMETYARPAIVN